MTNQAVLLFRLRSFVRRDSRETRAQADAYATLMPQYGLTLQETPFDFASIFGRTAPTYLEIGFGQGQSLLAAAKLYPDYDFIGIETHRPGIGQLLQGIHTEKLTNLRIVYADVIDVIEKGIADASLAGVQIFFPDPWPKRRHHPRRLVQTPFILRLLDKMQMGASLHLATDWDDYAKGMHAVLSQIPALSQNCHITPTPRSPFRPVISKFEQRALRDQRRITEFQYRKTLDKEPCLP